MFFVFNLATFEASFACFWALRGYFFGGPLGLFCGRGQVQKHFWNLPKLTINFGFGRQLFLFVFNSAKFWASFALFLGPLGLFLESGSGSKTFLEPTYVVNQLWFW